MRKPDSERALPLLGSLPSALELPVVGPFSWIPSSADDSPRVFDVPESRKCGLYLFAVSASAGELIYWVGQTSQPVRTRLATHSREFLAGTYNILDISKLRACQRHVVWQGLWWRKDSPDRFEEYLLRAGDIAPLTLAQLRATRVYILHTPKDRRLLARLEASVVAALYADPEVGSILDRGYSLSARWATEEPIDVRLEGPSLLGLPRMMRI